MTSCVESDVTQKMSYGEAQFNTNDTDEKVIEDPYNKYIQFCKDKNIDTSNFILQ